MDGNPFNKSGSTIRVPSGMAHTGSLFPLQLSTQPSYVFFLTLTFLVVGRFVVVVGLILTFVMEPLGATTRIFRLCWYGCLGGPGYTRGGIGDVAGLIVTLVNGFNDIIGLVVLFWSLNVVIVGGVDLNVTVGRLVPTDNVFVLIGVLVFIGVVTVGF